MGRSVPHYSILPRNNKGEDEEECGQHPQLFYPLHIHWASSSV